MTFKGYASNLDGWKHLPDKNKNQQQFYPIQRGKGPVFETISPMQGTIERAKIKLKKQVIKRKTSKKQNQSRVGKRRSNTVSKKRKPTKKTRKPTTRKSIRKKPSKKTKTKTRR